MAKIVVGRNQHEEMRRLHPKPAYSRVISVSMGLPDDSNWHYILTPVMGNRVWLLSVDVWVAPKAIDTTQATLFDISIGSGAPRTVEELRTWEVVLPILDENNKRTAWVASDGSEHFHWNMMRFYKGEARRFGIAGIRGTGGGDDLLKVSFEISEG